MTLKDSIQYHCEQLQDEVEDYDDAMSYIEDTTADVIEEHPNEDVGEVRARVITVLKQLFGATDEDED